MPEEDGTPLEARVAAFLSDRSIGSITGPRRMGREEFVSYVAGVAESMGLSVSRTGGGAEVLVFGHWRDVDDSLVAGGSDVLCGQDLCHQVPAVIRLNRLDPAGPGRRVAATE